MAVTNLKHKNDTIIYKFLLLLSGDVSLNPGTIHNLQISALEYGNHPTKKVYIFYIETLTANFRKKKEIRFIANKNKAIRQ